MPMVVDDSKLRALTALEDRLHDWQAQVNAATAALVAELAEAFRSGVWTGPGLRSFEHWVGWQCGVSPVHAQRLSVLARRFFELPVTMAAFAAGELTEDQVLVVARHAPAERDGQACDLARVCLVTQLERVLRTMPRPDTGPKPEPPARYVRFGTTDNGWRLTAHLAAEEGAVVQQFLTAGRHAVFHDTHPDSEPADQPGPIPEVSWADGLVRGAEIALDALDPAVREGRRPSDRFQVIVHVEDAEPGTARFHGGGRLDEATLGLLRCDSGERVAVHRDGVVVGLTRTAPTVDRRLRMLVEDRDGGCRVPGCPQRRWLHIHHVIHRCDGGETSYRNLIALCPYHHRQHHHGLLGIRGDSVDGMEFTDHYGRPIRAKPPRPLPANRPWPPPPRRYQPPLHEPLQSANILWN